jgi:hypothetical protein
MIFHDEVALVIHDIELAQIEIRAITPRSFGASRSGQLSNDAGDQRPHRDPRL